MTIYSGHGDGHAAFTFAAVGMELHQVRTERNLIGKGTGR